MRPNQLQAQSPVEQNLDSLESSLKKSTLRLSRILRTREAQKLFMARMLSSYYIIENMNHVLKHCESENMLTQMETYKDPSLPIKRELIDRISSFIKQ